MPGRQLRARASVTVVQPDGCQQIAGDSDRDTDTDQSSTDDSSNQDEVS